MREWCGGVLLRHLALSVPSSCSVSSWDTWSGVFVIRVLQLFGTPAYSHTAVLFSLTALPASTMLVCHIWHELFLPHVNLPCLMNILPKIPCHDFLEPFSDLSFWVIIHSACLMLLLMLPTPFQGGRRGVAFWVKPSVRFQPQRSLLTWQGIIKFNWMGPGVDEMSVSTSRPMFISFCQVFFSCIIWPNSCYNQ